MDANKKQKYYKNAFNTGDVRDKDKNKKLADLYEKKKKPHTPGPCLMHITLEKIMKIKLEKSRQRQYLKK